MTIASDSKSKTFSLNEPSISDNSYTKKSFTTENSINNFILKVPKSASKNKHNVKSKRSKSFKNLPKSNINSIRTNKYNRGTQNNIIRKSVSINKIIPFKRNKNINRKK